MVLPIAMGKRKRLLSADVCARTLGCEGALGSARTTQLPLVPCPVCSDSQPVGRDRVFSLSKFQIFDSAKDWELPIEKARKNMERSIRQLVCNRLFIGLLSMQARLGSTVLIRSCSLFCVRYSRGPGHSQGKHYAKGASPPQLAAHLDSSSVGFAD